MIRSHYLFNLFDKDNRNKLLKNTVEKIRNWDIEFDTICFTGHSGSLIVPEIATSLNKPFTLIRKNENHHSYYQIEGEYNFNKYLIIDDFIDTGNTILRIFNTINACPDLKFSHFDRKLVGIFTYLQNHGFPDFVELDDIPYKIPVLGI